MFDPRIILGITCFVVIIGGLLLALKLMGSPDSWKKKT